MPAAPVAPVDVAFSNTDGPRTDSLARAEAARRDSLARAAEAERRAAAARATLGAPIYFRYDRSDLTSDAKQLLDAKVPLLKATPALRMRLAGHTDERGSDEYNLALGQRRAAAARQYLIWQGIDEDRVVITSFGEEEPVCQESTESCWSRNRRVEFEITAGADRIAVR
jgi:peptidoglycan-associated lipoprotein